MSSITEVQTVNMEAFLVPLLDTVHVKNNSFKIVVLLIYFH